ncbi:endonuclease [Caerostris extrusa]|uniref:Endonuclease n=1 Tax=Caerostris extrusa TaxID=172846 RepID=A0AAV4MVD5_CAEEX|nr:endonuclease [Caerostris extrusa]
MQALVPLYNPMSGEPLSLSSSWGQPSALVKKKDGTWRSCGDYRALNAITQTDRHPLPQLHDFTHQLEGGTIFFFSTLDLHWVYRQIRESDIQKTAICTPFASLRRTPLSLSRIFIHDAQKMLVFQFSILMETGFFSVCLISKQQNYFSYYPLDCLCFLKHFRTFVGGEINVDITNRLSSSEGFHDCLTIIDCCSHWQEAAPISEIRAEAVTDVLVKIGFLGSEFWMSYNNHN